MGQSVIECRPGGRTVAPGDGRAPQILVHIENDIQSGIPRQGDSFIYGRQVVFIVAAGFRFDGGPEDEQADGIHPPAAQVLEILPSVPAAVLARC